MCPEGKALNITVKIFPFSIQGHSKIILKNYQKCFYSCEYPHNTDDLETEIVSDNSF